eukprot:1637087-Alexandrium_andersonii.AAC.1
MPVMPWAARSLPTASGGSDHPPNPPQAVCSEPQKVVGLSASTGYPPIPVSASLGGRQLQFWPHPGQAASRTASKALQIHKWWSS